jgi:biopolymer transport protein TolR
MALSANDAFSAGKRRHRRGRRTRGALAEINVTPLVDVMLVLLIIFMISAPLLTSGVQVELPKTEAGALQAQKEPLSISIRADGVVFVGEREVPFESFSPTIVGLSGGNRERPIYVRGDARIQWERMAQVMSALASNGFTKINLVTDTGGPSSGDTPRLPAKGN